MIDPYGRVAFLRMAIGYFEDDCDVCPAWALCRFIYDGRCQRGKCRHDIFPCGLKPTASEEIDWVAVRRSICSMSRSICHASREREKYKLRKTCLVCGQLISDKATRCRPCAVKHHYAEMREGP